MGRTLPIGRLAGIPIGIRPLWLLVVAVITWSLGHDYYAVEDPGLGSAAAYALGLLSALTLFGGIVLHELGHGSFPIVDDDGRALGIPTLDEVRAIRPDVRPGVAARQVASRDRDLLVDRELEIDELPPSPAFARIGRAVVVDAADRPLAIVSVTDLERRLRVAAAQI